MVNDLEKIAIVTLYDEINIGNKLQNYALQELLKKFAAVVETLTYTEASMITPPLGWKGKMVLKMGFPTRIAQEKRTILLRRDRFRDFSEQYLCTNKPKSFVEYKKDINSSYDFFVAGSDQIWHNFSNTREELDYFFLKFASKEKRICFAPSFGFDTIPEAFRDLYIEGLKGFETLSCRESEGCRMIKDLIGSDAQLLPDPTIVLPVDKWDVIEKEPEYNLPKNYILAYFIGGKSKEQEITLDSYSKKIGFPIIDIFDKNKLEYYKTRPDEFLYLIKRAECVLTNSYHGAIFSVIFNKAFRMFSRMDKDGMQMSSRFKTLVSEFELNLTDNDLYKPCERTNEIIKNKREQSNLYFKKVLRIDSNTQD